MTTTATLAANVRSLRLRLGVSQEELAKRVGCRLGTIGGIESGRVQNPRTSTLDGLARELRTTIDALVGRKP